MPKEFRPEEEVDSSQMQDIFDNSVPAYPTTEARTDDLITPVTDLTIQVPETEIEDGFQSSIGGTNRSYDVYNTNEHKPWRRLTVGETGLLQVIVTDESIEEDTSGTVFMRFRAWLCTSRATITSFTDPTYILDPSDLEGRVIKVDFRAVEYDPRPYPERDLLGSFTEARAHSDFNPLQGTLTWRDDDLSIVKFIDIDVYSNPEDRGNLPDGRPRTERFQIELFNFRGVKPLKDIGIGTIASTQLPSLRLEDVNIQTGRTSATDPNIGIKTYTVPISLSQAPGVDVNINIFTEDDTAIGTGDNNDYIPFNRNITIKANATVPESPVTGTLPNQILEATERFYVRAIPVAGDNPPILFSKPRAAINIVGQALRPRLSAPATEYGPGRGGGKPTTLYLYVNCSPAPDADSGPVTLDWRTDDFKYLTSAADAKPDYHYIKARGRLTFEIGESRKAIEIQTTWNYVAIPGSDDLSERRQDVQLSIDFWRHSSNAELAAEEGYINLFGETGDDADPIFTSTNVEVVEGRPIIVRGNLSTIPAPSRPATVNWTIRTTGRDGNAEPGVHYNPANTSGSFVFAGGTRNLDRSIRIPTIQTPGATIPNPRFFTVVFSEPVGGGNVEIETGRITCTIREAGTTASLPLVTISDLTVTEQPLGLRSYNLALTLSDKPPENTQEYYLDYATEQGTASPNINYEPITRSRARWTAQGTDFVFPVNITIIPEPISVPKQFSIKFGTAVRGGSQSGNLEISSDTAIITIRPRRVTDTGLPSMSVSDVRVRDDAGNAELTLSLSKAALPNTSVDYVTRDGTGKAGTNYTRVSSTANWRTGNRDITISIPIQPDDSNTLDHTFDVLFSGAENCTLADSQATVTILNTGTVRPPPEPEEPPSVGIADSRIQVPTSGTARGTLTISTSRTVNYPITGRINTFNGTAIAGTNYNALSNVAWTIPANSSSVTVPYVVRSTAITANVTFTATFTIDSGVDATIRDSTATITITTAAEPVTLRVEDLDLTDSSRTGNANVIVTRTGDLSPITFDLQTVNVSGGAIAGTHYTAIPRRQFSMGQGDTSLTVPIALATPTSRVPIQRFILRASNLSSGTINKADGTITLPAYNPPVVRVPEVSISNDGAVSEPGPGQTAKSVFTIKLNEVATENISGTFWTEYINSAVADVDYGSISPRQPLRWSIGRGSISTKVEVNILPDTVQEGRERFRGRIALDRGVNARITDDSASGVIDNRAAGVSLSVADFTASERGGRIRVPVTKSGTTNERVFFEAETYDTNSATDGEDYRGISRWRAAIQPDRSSVDIPIDTLLRGAQGIENFGLRITNPEGGATIDDGNALITLPSTEGVPVFLPPPIISVSFSSDALSSYGTLSVNYPIVIAVPVDSDITGSYRTGLTGTSFTLPRPGRPSVREVEWSRSRSGLWRIPAGSTRTIVPALVYRQSVGAARWITITAAVLISAAAAFAVAFAGIAAVAGTSTLVGSIGATNVVFTSTFGTYTVTMAGAMTTTVAGTSVGLTAAGAALSGGMAAAAGLGLGSTVAVGNQSIDSGDADILLRGFDCVRGGNIRASAEISNVRGPGLSGERASSSTTLG